MLVVVGKPGRSLCQYVALHLDLAQFAPQLNELLTLASAQWDIPGSGGGSAGLAASLRLAHLAQDAGDVWAELTRELAG